MQKLLLQRNAISRAAVSAIVIILIAAAVGGYYYISLGTTPGTTNTTTTTPGGSTTQTTSLGGSATGKLPTYIYSSKSVQTLTIDEWLWPIDDLNQLQALSELPWPNYLTFTVYQPLVSVNETAEYHTGNIQYLPGLAANWTVSPDGKTYTFNLRQGVTFSNGDPFNAYQVWGQMYGFYYLSGNSSTWLESYNFFDMSTADFGPATIAMMTSSGLANPSSDLMSIMSDSSWPIYVTGPNTIVFQLRSPFVWFPGAFVVFDGLMFDTNYVLQNGGFGAPGSLNTAFNQNPIPGTGPYVVSQVAENSFVKFTQNPTYWGKDLTADQIAAQPIFDPGHATTVIVYYKPDNIARFTDLKNGAAQISAVEASEWPVVTSNPSYSYLELPSWAGEVSLLGLNGHVYPTNITAVRQAIVHAINYTDVYAKAYQGLMTPYVGPEYPAWHDFYNLGNVGTYAFDINQAKQDLLSNHLDASSFPPLTFKVQAGCEACINVAQVVQADLAAINMTVDISVLSTSQYYSPFGNYQTNLQNAEQIGQLAFVNSGFGWSPATLTPADYWVTFVNNASIWGNWPAYSNPKVQACVDSFTSTNDISAIQNLCTIAQQQIYNDAPYAWMGLFKLWLPPGGSLVWDHNNVLGFYVDPVWNGESTTPIFNTVTFG